MNEKVDIGRDGLANVCGRCASVMILKDDEGPFCECERTRCTFVGGPEDGDVVWLLRRDDGTMPEYLLRPEHYATYLLTDDATYSYAP